MVKWKFIKQVPLEVDHTNYLIKPYLPANFDISIPSGSGELSILKVELHIPDNSDFIVADVLCNFSVTINHSIIYNTHLSIQIAARPIFHKQKSKIKFSDFNITSMKLISDKDSVLKNTRSLITGFLPEPLKSIFASTISLTEGVLSSIGMNELVSYLTLYLAGSTKTVFAYHRKEIEKKILIFANSDELAYELDQSSFEEKLFADYGKDVAIENGKIMMIFHH